MRYRKALCALLAAALLMLPAALSEEETVEYEEYDDVVSEPAEEAGEELTFTLGGDEEPEPTPVPEVSEDVDVYEQWDDEDYNLSYPDVTDKNIRAAVSASDRVYPGTLIWPLKGCAPLEGLSSHVGWRNAARIHGHQGGTWPSWLHHGVDVGGVGTDQVVVAAAGGLAYCGEKSGLGKYVVIDHGNGWYTRCQHLSRYAGKLYAGARGVPVEAGEDIGYVGSTGGDYPVHLHFEIAFSPDGPGGDDTDYQRETHNFRIKAYSFAQDSVVLLRWPARWELCTAENQNFEMLPWPTLTPEPSPTPDTTP